MAKTITNYLLDGSSREFQIPYEYLARKFIKVTLVGTTRVELKVLDDYRFTQKDQITLNRAWGPSDGFVTIEIRRVTSATERLVNFSDGSILRAYDLNISQIQAIHIAEEGRDISDSAMIQNGIRWDAFGYPIANLGYPTELTDAASAVFVRDQLARALRVQDGSTISELPIDRAGKILAFDSERNPVAVIPSAGSSMELELSLKDPTKGARYIAYRRAMQRATERSVQDQLDAGVVNIWEFAYLVVSRPVLTDISTWDWTPAFHAAVIACRGMALYVPYGVYTITRTTGDLLSLSSITIRGDGTRKTILKLKMPVGVLNGIAIIGSNVVMEDISIAVHGVSSSQVAMRFVTSSSFHRFTCVEIDGSNSSAGPNENFVHGITVTPSASVSNVEFHSVHVHHCRYGLFTANDQVGVLRFWSFVHCFFHHNSADDLEFNSFDNLSDTWIDFEVLHCNFSDWIGVGAGAGFAIGIDSGKRGKVIGCNFFGAYRTAVHIEDYLRDIQVSNCYVKGALRGIECYQKNVQNVVIVNNIIIGPNDWDMDVDPMTLPEPTNVDTDSVGIYIMTPGTASTGTGVKLSGNTVRGYIWGIISPVDRGGEAVNNMVSACSVGFHRNVGANPTSKRLRDNSVYHCKYAFSASTIMVLGRHAVEGCQHLVRGEAGKTIINFSDGLDLTITGASILGGSVTTGVPLFRMPTVMSVHGGGLSHNGPGAGNSFAGVVGSWDGSVLTSERKNQTSIGATNISGTPFANTAGMLCLTLFNGGAAGTASISADLQGSITFRF